MSSPENQENKQSDKDQTTPAVFDSGVTNLGAISDVLMGNGTKKYDLGNLRFAAMAYAVLGTALGSVMARKNAAEGKPPIANIFF